MIRSWLAKSLAAAAMAALMLGPAAGADDTYPTKPIRLIVPLSPGGVTDMVARLLAQGMTRDWGQQVVVENVAGAGGTLGAEAGARAAADGYTLLMGTVSSNAINASLYKNLRYDNIRDFAPISLVAIGPNMLVVNPSLPVHTVAELIALLRANPDKYSYGSTGVGTSVHLLAERFKTLTGTSMTHVPYKGSGPMTLDLTAGHVQLSFDNMPTALAQVKAGKLRALAVTSPERWPTLPDVPTVAETIPGFVGISWQGLFAPKGVPEPILEKISAEVRKILAEPAIKERFLELGTQAVGNTRAEFAAFVATETARWAEMVKLSGAQVN
ncbi:tripartite tricarboxylate transporter substrate binding protein [Xanthobacter dioxanivorans]|uniref:Tripartite tricarboxylate transporter substrate binding protein n=2 Tax=Xanthobacter dioxanivorans TaxID=2528964 RepID=A0A974PN28_9HYPH|nr:tripartite tricarboxylate transporter substrate binding protein [Xanthobacter dioxanivorans]